MADITAARANIQIEETGFKAAVSESVFKKVGGSINFINNYQYIKFEFGIAKMDVNSGSPSYAGITTPFTNWGSIEMFATAAEIVGIELLHSATGSGGTSELDIKWAASNSGSFASIFSTTPKVVSTAPALAQFDTFGTATTPTGCTVPVLSKTTFAAGDVLRCDVLQVMSGSPNGFTMSIYYRPI